MKTLLLSLFLSVCTSSALADVVTAAQDPWPPFVNSSGDPGISVDIVSAALATQGHQLEMKIMPWSRAMNEVKNANIDLLVATWFTEERATYLHYSDHYAINQVKFITLASDRFEYQGLDSLSGKSVGIARGYGYGDDFSSAANFRRPEANDLIANLKKLATKRIDMTLDDEIVARAQMAENGLDASAFRFTRNALSENKLFVTSGTANSRGQRLIDAFNKGLAEIKQNGTYDQIMAKYGVK